MHNFPRQSSSKWTRSILVCMVLAAIALSPAAHSQTTAPHLYSVPPGGLSQFPVRNGPATEDYVSLEKANGFGLQAPSYTLTDAKGKAVSLTTLLHGKIAVLDFWGTTCGPCLRAMPHLGKLAQKYRAQNVVFLSICESQKDTAEFRRLMSQFHSPALRFLLDPATEGENKSLRALLHNGMGQPAQIIFSRQGRVIGALQGYDDTKDPNLDILRQSIDNALFAAPQARSLRSSGASVATRTKG
jgi:thiol-disulfide isomerase/thioredoxin